jgi:hypothetical protein
VSGHSAACARSESVCTPPRASRRGSTSR